MTTPILILGEAWGKDEAQISHPFVGQSGAELWRMLADAGFPLEPLPYRFTSPYSMVKRWATSPIPLLNVFNCRSPDPDHKNRVDYFYASFKDEIPIDKDLPRRRFGSANAWVKSEYAPHISQLHSDLERLKPNLILALGNTALWALGLPVSIGKLRGSVIQSKWGKVLPIYHPAAVLSNWSFRILVVMDLLKAQREMLYPEIRTIDRYVWTEPSIEDLYSWWEQHGKHAKLLALDIETLRKTQISEIGFASSSTQALHIPFLLEERVGNQKTYRSYWPDIQTEVKAWEFVKMVCESSLPKIGQNAAQYDAYWIVKELGIKLRNYQEDTMVKAHCWQPELEKNLGFLGSVFLNDVAWKHIRTDVAKDMG